MRNDQPVLETTAIDFKRRRAVQRCRHDTLKRYATEALLVALIVVGADGFGPGQRQSRSVTGRQAGRYLDETVRLRQRAIADRIDCLLYTSDAADE